MKQNMDQPSCKWNLLRLFVLICTTLASTFSFGQAGTAPMVSLPQFPGGFQIDGFLQRQGANGDWLQAAGGSANNYVFTNAGAPVAGLIAFHQLDLFNDQDNDDIFDGGNKLFQNPNVWGWRSQKPPAKDDINNALVFIALNPIDNHIWLAISGDRMSDNGTSYLDFEFYQNTITKIGGPTTGGFNSTGPHNGRTVGDLSITLEFTNGGSLATTKYLQWQPGAEAGSFDYFDVTPPAGSAFAAANAGTIDVPYGAFGATTYAANLFAEGAVDLTAVIGGTGLPGECGSLPFKSLFIKTKSSAEKTADLKDFIAPLSINVCFDRTAPTIACPNTLNLGCNPTIPSPSGATASDNCDGTVIPVAADGPVQSSGCNRTMIRTWRAQDDCGNTASCGQTINWTEDNTAPVFTGSYADQNLGCNPANPDGSLGSASASDACGSVTITQSDGSITSDGCNRARTRSFSARDACGNTSSTSRTVRWVADITPPAFTGSYGDQNLGCNPANPDASLGSASATDGCGPVTITQSDGSVTSDGCNRSRVRTFTARDGCNNTATVSRRVNWIADNTAPVFTGSYADQNLGCNPANPDGSLGSASATDGCGPVTITQSDGGVTSDGCNRSRVRTFTAVDGCGNTATVSRRVNWIADVTPPVFTGSYGDQNLGCNPANPDASLGSANATDGCGPVTISQSDGSITSDGCNRSRVRTFTARDGCNNTATVSRRVNWISDLTPPVFTGSYADQNAGCNPANPDASLGSASATDGCGPVTITQSDGNVVSDGCNRSRTRTFTATDGCLNTSTVSRTVRWVADLTPPVFTSATTPVDLGCFTGAVNLDAQLGGATASDACGIPTITFTDGAVQSNGCARSATRTYTATDACGNTATVSRSVTFIFDPTPPVFTGSYADQNLGCNPGNPDGSLGTATATDGCGPVTITSSDGPIGSDGCNRARTRTFTARDACNNTSTVSRTVRWISDLTPPVFTGSYADQNLGCNPANPDAALGSASATDGCGPVTITQSDGGVTSDGCNRSRVRTFTAVDGCGNTATVSRRVNWISDLTPPVFTGSYADQNLGCNPADPNAALGSASATDGCGPVTITQSDGSVTSDGCNRSRVRTFTANDGCGNTATVSRRVNWISDLTPPVFTGSYADQNLGCNPADPDAALGSASATDGCGPVTITQSDGSVTSDGCNRSRVRTFTARDGCGNTATVSRRVNWISDLTPPVFTGSYADQNLGCNPADPDAALGSASATDGCGPVTISQQDGSVTSDGCNRSRVRTFTARDGCGNTATVSRRVNWISDVTPPVFTGSYADQNLGCNPANPDAALGSASATDGCGPVTITQSDGGVTSDGCNRSRVRTFTARDGCGNTATVSRRVNWISDLTPPVFTGSYADQNLGCNPANPDAALGSASATDGCGPVTITQSDGSVTSDGCNRARARTFTARDGCGNTATISRTVRWVADVTPPVFVTTPASVDLDCGSSIPSSTTPTASDACGTPTVTQTGSTDNSADCATGFNRIVTRTWTARDACSNTATYTQTIRVRCCPSAFCTYTMGQYGTEGGGGCDGVNDNVSTYGLISLGLSRWPGGTLVVGKPGRSITMSNNATDIACIIDVLPGNQGSDEIVAGDQTICNLPASMLTNQHRLKNVLGGQTITLGINMGINVQLGNFALQAGTMATAKPLGGCGSNTPTPRICHYNTLAPYNLTSVENQYTFRTFSAALIAAIPGTKNVTNLFELANRALGNTDGVDNMENGVSLDEIQQAVANINEGFDDCMVFVGWNVAACPAIDPTPGDGRIAPTTTSAQTLTVTAFPNPYQENFSLRVSSPVTGQAMISFYTIDGVKIAEMKRDVVANKDQWVPFNVPAVYRTRIVYTVTIGKHNAKGVVLSPN